MERNRVMWVEGRISDRHQFQVVVDERQCVVEVLLFQQLVLVQYHRVSEMYCARQQTDLSALETHKRRPSYITPDVVTRWGLRRQP